HPHPTADARRGVALFPARPAPPPPRAPRPRSRAAPDALLGAATGLGARRTRSRADTARPRSTRGRAGRLPRLASPSDEGHPGDGHTGVGLARLLGRGDPAPPPGPATRGRSP